MTFAATFAVLCPLCSFAKDPSPVEEAAAEVEEQAEQAEQAEEQAVEVEEEITDIAETVKAHRFERLSAYATEKSWSLTVPPDDAHTNPEVAAWWAEWVVLALERQALEQAVQAQQEIIIFQAAEEQDHE